MKILLPSFLSFKSDTPAVEPVTDTPAVEPVTDTTHINPASTGYQSPTQGVFWPIVNKNFDGEKNIGELGYVTRNILDHQRLRLRSYDAYITNDSVKIVSQKHFKFVVGSGLKLQSEPEKTILEALYPDFDFGKFKKTVEARWNLYANSTVADFSGEKTLHQLAMHFYKGRNLGGDCLLVLRFDDKGPNIQYISGEFLQTPFDNQDGLIAGVTARGNYVEHGIEFNAKGEHVSYFVRIKDKDNLFGKFERILAKGEKTGRRMAWVLYCEQVSLDHKRGIPKATPILEKAAKLDRYTEASVSKAEQAANLLYTIEHLEYSTGEDPLAQLARKKMKLEVGGKSSYELADAVANSVSKTTNNTTVNMPNGASLKSFGTNIETNFEQFEGANFGKIAAAMDVPPEVALQKYSSNYSASRAATGAWGYTVDIERDEFVLEFYKKIYACWLEFHVLKNYIEAPGYVMALRNGDYMVVESYIKCRFIGKNMPHIDPLKEAKAARVFLGEDQTPLASREQVTEGLNLGDWNQNFLQFNEEQKMIDKLIPPTDGDTTGQITE